ncbi:12366_t:CDS:2, partial [Acaulospora colombiana]
EPISEFPIDLLIFHIIVPATFTLAKPKRLFRTLFENWWHITSHRLRLTSFMFGGERRYDEEGTHVRKTWRAVFLNLKAPLDGTGDENDEVVFVRDGVLVRAPGYDGVPVIPGKRMLIPVNEDGTLLNPEDAPIDDDLGYTIVYTPPNFKARIIGRGVRHLNIRLATTVFVIPVGGSALAAVILPALTAYVIISLFAIKNAATAAIIQRYVYPIFLAMVFGYRLQRQTTQLIQNWMQTVRDEEYLIGRRLHNIEPNEQENVSGSSRNASVGPVAE